MGGRLARVLGILAKGISGALRRVRWGSATLGLLLWAA